MAKYKIPNSLKTPVGRVESKRVTKIQQVKAAQDFYKQMGMDTEIPHNRMGAGTWQNMDLLPKELKRKE